MIWTKYLGCIFAPSSVAKVLPSLDEDPLGRLMLIVAVPKMRIGSIYHNSFYFIKKDLIVLVCGGERISSTT